MSRNGSGTYTLPAGQPVVTGTTISSTTFNTLTSDLASALTTSVSSDGQTPITGGLKALDGTAGACSYTFTASAGTGLYSPATNQAAIAAGGVQVMKWASGATTITGTASITGQLTSTLATGTAPFVVTSTTQVANLNVATAGAAPLSGITGLGTGVGTALAINVGTAGSPVVNAGALGSPSSAGTMPAYTLGGTVTATGQEITSPVLNTAVAKGTWTASGTWTLPAHTLGGAITGAGQNVSGLGTLGCGAITSGIITSSGATNGLTIKDTNAYSAGSNGGRIYLEGLDSTSANTTLGEFHARALASQASILYGKVRDTSGTITTAFSLTSTGINSTAIGATTPSTGAFTTLTTSGTATYATTISVGNATPSASGAGITFPATQSPSTDANTLDDYEEGTWTPGLTPGTSGSITLTTPSMTYRKIGNTVRLGGSVNVASISSPVGILKVTSLPFNPSVDTAVAAETAYFDAGTPGNSVQGHVVGGSSQAYLYWVTAGTPSATLANSARAGSVFTFSAVYNI